MRADNDATGGNAPLGVPELGRSDFAAIAAIMQAEARISLLPAKITLVQSRLSRRLRTQGLESFHAYVEHIRRDPVERAAMIVALTTNHTHFFRENHHFDHLRATVLPQLQANAGAGRPVRIWSAGCSTGEEVYSIAMCLLGPTRASASWLRNADVRLLATDLAPHVVDSTRRGVYAAATVEPVPSDSRATWMRADGADFVMADEARQLVTAQVLNLFESWPMRRAYDVIFCRNVMIYFDDAAKAELEARLVDMLVPGGYLYIGHSERLAGAAAAATAPCGQTIYTKRAAVLQ
jgi:chemotaxis protein methyltransferase CheR